MKMHESYTVSTRHLTLDDNHNSSNGRNNTPLSPVSTIHQYAVDMDWNASVAQHVLPSDYPSYAPHLFSKSLRAFFSKRISSFAMATTTNQPLSSKPTSPIAVVMDRRPTDSEANNLTSAEDCETQLQQTWLKRSFSLVPERFDGVATSPRSGRPLLADRSMLHCEHLLVFVACILVVLGLPFSLLFCLRVIAQYERAVIFRFGRLTSKEAFGPGLIFTIPCLDTVQRVDLRTFTFDVPTQEVLTRDSVTVAVNAVVYYRIYDPVMSVVNVKNVNYSTRLLAQTTLRNVLGTVDMCALLTDREHIAALMQENLDAATDTWGMKVERVEIKDVRLPIQLQRTLAAEAEATREAKAKVIAAHGEKEASRSLKEAAMEISHCPVALQLRYLQTLSGISAEKNSTIIFPLPIELLSYLRQLVSRPSSCVRESTSTESWIYSGISNHEPVSLKHADSFVSDTHTLPFPVIKQ
ncbi:Mechanosensory protein 2 [Fasciola gigantica]|uniref:Mechanosensory protein 2 n=1 Tax=Fasciola gigantica TaxID=46835 RepID=A0A504YHM9_FASGI|nr:Mechanosensory protein 2 [Fasciola gigantica]